MAQMWKPRFARLDSSLEGGRVAVAGGGLDCRAASWSERGTELRGYREGGYRRSCAAARD